MSRQTTSAMFAHATPSGTYDVTKWESYLWSKRSDARTVNDAVTVLDNAVGDKHDDDKTDPVGTFARETFARLYGNPERIDGTAPRWAGKAHDLLASLPEWDVLREAVAGDADIAALAAAQVLPAVAGKLAEIEREAERAANGQPSNDKDAAAIRAGMRKAIAAASGDAEKAREALAGLAPGLDSAPATHEQADRRRLDLATTLLRSPSLREVLRRAGRIERLMRDTRKTPDLTARNEVLDLERGADLSRVLPAQLAGLKHPTLRKLVKRDLLSRSCLQYKLGGKEHLGRGPIIVALDRSGSMEGSAEQWASATAIALVAAGVRERRTVTVVEFTATPDNVIRVAGKRGTRLAVNGTPRGEVGDVAAVALELASRNSHGGTQFGPVLDAMLGLGLRDERADFVFVTDGHAEPVNGKTLDALTEAKANGLRVFGLTVNGGQVTPALAALCDVVVALDGEADVASAIAKAMPHGG